MAGHVIRTSRQVVSNHETTPVIFQYGNNDKKKTSDSSTCEARASMNDPNHQCNNHCNAGSCHMSTSLNHDDSSDCHRSCCCY